MGCIKCKIFLFLQFKHKFFVIWIVSCLLPSISDCVAFNVLLSAGSYLV